MNPALVPVPDRMQQLPRDRRGYPIPKIVLLDDHGLPHFTINDTRVVLALARADACHICGERLGAHKWFVGGPLSALHHAGAYRDGPMHRECGQYALKVCPYLSRANAWSKRIGDKTLRPGALKEAVVFEDPTVSPDQPSVFAFADCAAYALGRGVFHPIRPWREVQFWRDGAQITSEAARQMLAADPRFSEIDHWWKEKSP
jgi:hypothetical protein